MGPWCPPTGSAPTTGAPPPANISTTASTGQDSPTPTDDCGRSHGLPGSTHYRTAAGHPNVVARGARAQLYLDTGYVGGNLLLIPGKGGNLPKSYPEAHRTHPTILVNTEHGFAVKTGKTAGRFRTCPRQIGAFTHPVLTLQK